jgi:tRNA pseudouridine55 synthase
MTSGILLVDKPAGWTSFDVLAKLRRALGTRRLGHSGTLDPMATGVLVVFIGNATAAADRQLDHDKIYEAVLRLGIRTDTGDITGTVQESALVSLGQTEFCSVLPQFVGKLSQLPPMYSAIKVHGQPLYKAARAGKTVERQPREVTVYSLDYLGSPAPNDYALRVSCSKGTYIRTLAEDIGSALKVPATLASLRRTRAGVFDIGQAHTLPDILAAAETGRIQNWIFPVETVFAALPQLKADARIAAHLLNGCPTSGFRAADGTYRVHTAEGTFLGLATVQDHVLRVDKLFCERNGNGCGC